MGLALGLGRGLQFKNRVVFNIWILTTGFWNDNSTWDDTATWID